MTRYDGAWRLLRMVLTPVVVILLRPRVRGRENVPAAGPALLVSNHRSFWDIPLLGAVQPRTLRFMAKSELFGFRPVGRFLAWGGAFPVRRGLPDRQALRTVHDTMVEGGVVAIFIEGTRHVNLEQAKAGAGRLAVVEGVPVVPVALRGTDRWRPGRRVSVAFGPPRLHSRNGRRTGQASRETSAELLERIRGLYEGLE
ncbi:MAG TPA: lysophospholipid acyltransferase family protein [Gaiellales bacterium]|nr:lysophospholipid acyltransferase family protein [Gaiellales bacterium]